MKKRKGSLWPPSQDPDQRSGAKGVEREPIKSRSKGKEKRASQSELAVGDVVEDDGAGDSDEVCGRWRMQ